MVDREEIKLAKHRLKDYILFNKETIKLYVQVQRKMCQMKTILLEFCLFLFM